LPVPSVPLAAPIAPSRLLAFAVGTPDVFNWRPIFARTAEEAFAIWRADQGYDEEECPFDEEGVARVSAWDGKTPETITPADWIRGGLGYSCSRCGDDTHADDALLVGSEVVCEACQSFGDLVTFHPERAVEQLFERILDDGVADAQLFLERENAWAKAQAEVWPRALAEAQEEMALAELQSPRGEPGPEAVGLGQSEGPAS